MRCKITVVSAIYQIFRHFFSTKQLKEEEKEEEFTSHSHLSLSFRNQQEVVLLTALGKDVLVVEQE